MAPRSTHVLHPVQDFLDGVLIDRVRRSRAVRPEAVLRGKIALTRGGKLHTREVADVLVTCLVEHRLP